MIMNTSNLMEKLTQLKLSGMTAALEEQLQIPESTSLSFEERLDLLVDRESLCRENRKIERLLKRAQRRIQSTIADLDFRVSRNLKRAVILSLASGDWIQQSQNLIISGPTGVGKTFLSCALLTAACRNGITGRYYRLSRLLYALRIARADGTYGKLLQQLQKFEVLVIDDWGLPTFTESDREQILEVIEDRSGIRSTIISTQLPVSKWHAYIGDAMIADAICDRLIHPAHQIQLKGDSMRKNKKPPEKAEPGKPEASYKKSGPQSAVEQRSDVEQGSAIP